MGGITIRDTDRGYAALVKRVYGIAHPRVEVGILAGAGADEPAVGSDDLTLLEVAVCNEFGTTDLDGNILVPERSFIRGWFDENEAKLRALLLELMKTVVSGKRTKEQALEMLALVAIGQIQERISAGIEPENAPSTIARKGSSTPLIDKGQLRAGISSRIGER